MRIIASFEHSDYLEMAITSVERKGIQKQNILAVPLDTRDEDRMLFDTIHQSDGLSLFDLPSALGTIFMLFGAIYGFILEWGPIWWGIIGLLLGIALGFIIRLVVTKKHVLHRQKGKKSTEVFLVIECQKQEQEMIQKILWNHHALGIGKLDK